MAIFIGVFFTDIGLLEVLLRSLIPVSMIIFVDFYVFDVPGRIIYLPAPEEYVLVFGWVAIVFNLGYMLWSAHG